MQGDERDVRIRVDPELDLRHLPSVEHGKRLGDGFNRPQREAQVRNLVDEFLTGIDGVIIRCCR